VELEHFRLNLRPRNHWEAMDLGVLLARHWWRPLSTGWLVVAVPVMLLSGVVLGAHPGLASIVVWWLKPLYERIPLHRLSRGIFSDMPSLADSFSEWRRIMFSQMLPRLTYRRFSFTRSFVTPVDMLEGLKGSQRMQRLKVLSAGAGSEAFWLTVICVHVEAFLLLGALGLFYLLIPAQVEVDWWAVLVGTQTLEYAWLWNILYFLAISLVSPVYVACGFMLYINRRVELEGWDIELSFRKLLQRVAPSGRSDHRTDRTGVHKRIPRDARRFTGKALP